MVVIRVGGRPVFAIRQAAGLGFGLTLICSKD